MKTKRVVVGTLTAALLAFNVCSLPVTFAADETVQISVGKTTAEAGGEFSVDVSLSDIPSTGITACDFAVSYDSSVLTVTSVDAGSMLDIEDESSSLLPLFASEIIADNGIVNLMWSTAQEDSSYWLKDDGVFCTIKGTVAADAADGTVAELKLIPIQRAQTPGSDTENSTIGVGYFNDAGVVRYSAVTSDGSVTIGTGAGEYLPGDADVSGKVDTNDVVKVMCYSISPTEYPLEPQGLKNADVYQTGDGVTSADAFSIQKKLVNLLDTLPES